MIKLVVAEVVSDKTGPWLKRALEAERVQLAEGDTRANAIVGLGVEIHSDLPSLNAKAGVARGKLKQLETLSKAGVLVPEFSTKGPAKLPFPLLGRKLKHTGGKDIKLYLQPKDIDYKGASDFYVRFIPSVKEWRTWVFRREVLASYEKVLGRRELLDLGVGRNESNGFVFEYRDSEVAPRGAVQVGVEAVAACGLDFGAVDILEGTDGKFYVLEVNTAPGANGAKAVGLRKLAKRIAKWERDGYPQRER